MDLPTPSRCDTLLHSFGHPVPNLTSDVGNAVTAAYLGDIRRPGGPPFAEQQTDCGAPSRNVGSGKYTPPANLGQPISR